MDIQGDKIELAKRLLDTDNVDIIAAVKSIFKDFDADEDWGDLPDKVITDAKESLRQLDAGLQISHDKAREAFKKWI